MDQNNSSLADRIGETVENFMSALPEDEAQTVAGSFEKLYASQVAETALTVGDIAPDFTLPNVTGQPVSLYEVLKRGPVVVSFYRGGWCPFCNLELHALQLR
ncbi:MAG: redoxin domain-containing protein, partial [Gammaproteobacteria bacterium]